MPWGSLLNPRLPVSHSSNDTESESDCGVPTLLLGSTSAGDMLDTLAKPGGDVNFGAGFGTEDTGDGRRVGCELDGPKGASTVGFELGCKLDGDD